MILPIVLILLAVILVVGLGVAAASVRVLREYERAVVFRLGRVTDQRGPGVILLVPFVDRMVRVSLRTVTLQIPPQEVITRDNVPARVTAVTYFRVIDPNKSIVEIQDVKAATSQIAQTTLRSVLGKAELDTLLSEREQLNDNLQHIIDDQTEPWGVKVTTVEIKDVEIPAGMQHAMARQAEAERERRAKIIDAEGEFQAAAKLLEAADLIGRNPVTIQLRYLQTLREVGGNENSTIVFPFPLELQPLLSSVRDAASGRVGAAPARGELDSSTGGASELPASPGATAELAASPGASAAELAASPGASAAELAAAQHGQAELAAAQGDPGDLAATRAALEELGAARASNGPARDPDGSAGR